MVVVGIMILMTAVVLVQSSKFNGSILMRSLAANIGLSIREAQLYGVSVKQASATTSGFSHAYGVHLASNTSYSVFADTNDDNMYSDGDSIVDTFTLPNGFTMDVCVENSVSSTCIGPCPSSPVLSACSTANTPITSLDIMFKRPNPNASFMVTGGVENASYNGAVLVLLPPPNSTAPSRTITVYPTGLIAIQ